MAINLTRQGACLKYKDTSSGFVKYTNLKDVSIVKIRGSLVILNDGSEYNYSQISSPSVASAEALADAIGTFKNEANSSSGGGGGGAEDMIILFADGGAITANTIIEPVGGQSHFNQEMGFVVPKAGLLKEIAFTTGLTSAVASESISLSIRKLSVGTGTTGNGTQLTVSSGVQIGTVSLASGGALGAAYYRNNVSVGIDAAVQAGDILFCVISNYAFWSISNVLVEARIQFN